MRSTHLQRGKNMPGDGNRDQFAMGCVAIGLLFVVIFFGMLVGMCGGL